MSLSGVFYILSFSFFFFFFFASFLESSLKMSRMMLGELRCQPLRSVQKEWSTERSGLTSSWLRAGGRRGRNSGRTEGQEGRQLGWG